MGESRIMLYMKVLLSEKNEIYFTSDPPERGALELVLIASTRDYFCQLKTIVGQAKQINAAAAAVKATRKRLLNWYKSF